MTRIIWKLIKEKVSSHSTLKVFSIANHFILYQLILPYLDIDFKYFDLSL